MERSDAEEYTSALGNVFNGSWRLIAVAQKLGVPHALGLSTSDWVQERLGGYVRLSIEDRQEAVAELAADGLTRREIGSILGVGFNTVQRDLVGDDPVPNGTADDEPHAQMPAPFVPNGTADDEPEPPNAPTGNSPESDHSDLTWEDMTRALPNLENKLHNKRMRSMVARGLSQFTSNILVLDPRAAAEVVDESTAVDVLRFRRQTDAWIESFSAARQRGLRAVK